MSVPTPLQHNPVVKRKRTVVYIDGLNLFYGALKGTGYKWLDVVAFVNQLLPHDDLVQIRYFTAVVNPRPNDPRISLRQETYLRALSTFPEVSIHRGRFTRRMRTRVLADEFVEPHQLFIPHFRPRAVYSAMWWDKVRRRTNDSTLVRVVIEEEKGSDVNLAAYLVHDSARGLMNKALVISNDSDLTDAIRLAREFGPTVGILNPHKGPTSRHLRDAASFELHFRRHIIRNCQLPLVLTDNKGREIHKPREWR